MTPPKTSKLSSSPKSFSKRVPASSTSKWAPTTSKRTSAAAAKWPPTTAASRSRPPPATASPERRASHVELEPPPSSTLLGEKVFKHAESIEAAPTRARRLELEAAPTSAERIAAAKTAISPRMTLIWVGAALLHLEALLPKLVVDSSLVGVRKDVVGLGHVPCTPRESEMQRGSRVIRNCGNWSRGLGRVCSKQMHGGRHKVITQGKVKGLWGGGLLTKVLLCLLLLIRRVPIRMHLESELRGEAGSLNVLDCARAGHKILRPSSRKLAMDM